MNGRLQQYMQGIQSPDPDVRLTTLNELCSLLVMSNEETLPGFQFRVLYPPLRDCLADENEANAEISLTACRALTYLNGSITTFSYDKLLKLHLYFSAK